MTDEELEVAIATYRVELIEEAGLARGDLDELEDHLRALVTELRAAGVSAQIAFVEATRRLGQPHALAREFAHTRPVFGARPSRAAAWSALALMLISMIPASIALVRGELHDSLVPYHVLGWISMAGLAFRTSWARAMIFGDAALGVLSTIYVAAMFPPVPTWVLLQGGVVDLGLVAFLAPTRRHPLTARGWALAVTGFGAIAVSQSQALLVEPLGNGSIAPYLFGIAGILLCARWATSALLAVAAVAVIAVPELWAGATSNVSTGMSFALHLASIAALVTAALLARRGARGAGSLRVLAR